MDEFVFSNSLPPSSGLSEYWKEMIREDLGVAMNIYKILFFYRQVHCPGPEVGFTDPYCSSKNSNGSKNSNLIRSILFAVL